MNLNTAVISALSLLAIAVCVVLDAFGVITL